MHSPDPLQNFDKAARAMSMVSPSVRAKAEVYYGDETCRNKLMSLLTEIGLPHGIVTLQEIEEYGYVKENGFVWLKQKKKSHCKVQNTMVSYDTLVTAYFEHNKIKNLTGVKVKEFLILISLSEIYVNHSTNPAAAAASPLITFKTAAGLSKSFPLSLQI